MRILLVDDHSIVRTGVKSIVQQNLEWAEIHEAWDEESVRRQSADRKFDIIISDLTFSHAQDSNYFTGKMLPLYGEQPVLILSMQPPQLFAKKYLQLGVRGYVHKEAPDFQILEAVNHVLERGFYRRNLDSKDEESKASENPFDRLSPREMEVARYVVKGESLKMIAHKLNLQVSTISTFKLRILEKLEVDSTLELARIYDQFCPE